MIIPIVTLIDVDDNDNSLCSRRCSLREIAVDGFSVCTLPDSFTREVVIDHKTFYKRSDVCYNAVKDYQGLKI